MNDYVRVGEFIRGKDEENVSGAIARERLSTLINLISQHPDEVIKTDKKDSDGFFVELIPADWLQFRKPSSPPDINNLFVKHEEE